MTDTAVPPDELALRIAQVREYVETGDDDGHLTRHNVLRKLDGREGTRHAVHVCACGDRWPDPGMGCGHTAWRCESTEGAGMFDPDAITGPNGPRCEHCGKPIAGDAIRDQADARFWHADLDDCRATALDDQPATAAYALLGEQE